MPPVQNNNNNLAHELASHLDNPDSNSLIVKIYSQLLTNSTVQSGLKQITRISQPLIEKFDDNFLRLAGNLRKWISKENIYNQLSNIWLSHSFPVQDTIVSYETFAKEFSRVPRSVKRQYPDDISKNFYNFACLAWNSLNDPSLDDIKYAILGVTAKTINQAYAFEDETLAVALVNMMREIIEKRRELVSAETFFKLVKVSIGEEFYNRNQQATKGACEQYYTFAKRFLIIDFPLATNNKDALKLIVNFIQENSFYYGNSTLNFMEKRLDTLLRLAGHKVEENIEDKTIAEKAQRILRKMKILSGYPLKKAGDVFHQVQDTKAYGALDKRFNLNHKVDLSFYLAAYGYNLLKENLLLPSVATYRVLSNKAKSQVTVIIDGLDVQNLKKHYTRLHAKYEILQKCVVIVADETVKLILDEKALAALEAKGKKEMDRLYHELKTLETKKIVEISMEYYASILKKAKRTYKIASKAVYYKKIQAGDLEGASAIKPPREVDPDNSDSQPGDLMTRSGLEMVNVGHH